MAARRSREPGKSHEPVTPASEEDFYLEELAAGLEIDLRKLAEELSEQPTLFHRVGRELVRRRGVRDARRRELRAAKARVDAGIRRSAREVGVDVSDEAVRVQVGDHADVARLARATDDASQRAYAARRVYEAFRQRARMLQALVLLQSRGG